MRIEAVYDNGNLQFSQPVELKNKRLKVVVVIPDEEIKDNIISSTGKRSGIGKKLDQILGKYRGGGEYVSPDHDKEAWHNHLEDKYLK